MSSAAIGRTTSRPAIDRDGELVDCVPTIMPIGDAVTNNDDRVCGDFSAGRFAWKRDEFRLFERPIPYRGAQGIFVVPDDLIPIWVEGAVERPESIRETKRLKSDARGGSG